MIASGVRAVCAVCVLAVIGMLTGCATGEDAPPETMSAVEVPARPAEEIARFAGDAQPLAQVAPGVSVSETVEVDGQPRTMLIDVPSGPIPEGGYPVLFFFHGKGDNAENFRKVVAMHKTNAVVVYPQGLESAWQGGPYAVTNDSRADETMVALTLARLGATLPIRWGKVYAAGMSNGGGFASLLGCRMPDVFAGTASVSAAYYHKYFAECSDKPMATLDIHGTQDPVIQYHGGIRHGEQYDSVDRVLERATQRNACTGPIHVDRVTQDVVRKMWTQCVAPIKHISIGGGQHVWPRAENDPRTSVPDGYATREIKHFFRIEG
ncbi:secreted esterase B [Corynebacterium renale]|uniref:alpha/beta hydrolase family esterase n=1 Tax=Corynebacterium renale TaxID=1724 RepID=UPI000DA3DC28|nr:PHB depolymerase family esterase [Corynebacterium renale]SQG64646.1 secreted esterase B [Corynebacterium renale]